MELHGDLRADEETHVHLLHLPGTVLVAIFDCLGAAEEVVRAAIACKALWQTASAAQFNQVHTIRFSCFHPQLRHIIPNLVHQFPNITQLDLANCCALAEHWMQPMAKWQIKQLNVANLWHWNGAHSTCLLAWSSTLTHLTADATNLSLADEVPTACKTTTAVTPAAGAAANAVVYGAVETETASPAAAAAHATGAADVAQLQRHHPQPRRDMYTAPVSSRSAATAPHFLAHLQQQQQQLPGMLSRRQQQQQSCSSSRSSPWWAVTGQVQQLQLRRLLVDNPIRCRMHGSSDCNCSGKTLLSELLCHNPALTHLDLSGNVMMPDRILHYALTGSCTALQTFNLKGCELVRPGYVGACCPRLIDLDLAGTATADADLALLAGELMELSRLSINNCKKVSDVGIEALAAAPAVVKGQLRCLDISRLTRTSSSAITLLMAALARGCIRSSRRSRNLGHGHHISSSSRSDRVLLHLGLSHTAGVTDACFEALINVWTDRSAGLGCAPSITEQALRCDDDTDVADATFLDEEFGATLHINDDSMIDGLESFPVSATTAQIACQLYGTAGPQQQQQQQPTPGLCGLELAGCHNISGFTLHRLAQLGFLSDLTTLDLSDVEALRQPGSSWNVGANVVAVAGRAGLWHQEKLRATASTQSGDCLKVSQRSACSDGEASGIVHAESVPESVLGGVLAYTGSQLLSLTLDGCYVDDVAAAFIGLRCTRLQQLSLVGCRGLQSAGLKALLQRCCCCSNSIEHHNASSTGLSSGTLRSLQLGGSHSRWRESEVLAASVTGLTEFRLVRRSSVRSADLAPFLAANTGLKSLALVGCYSLTDDVFTLADELSSADACASSNCGMRLTELILTACDGLTGSSISLLRDLRHLRVSFCVAFSVQAVQQIVLSCNKLILLELPEQLQRQLNADRPGSGFHAHSFGSTQSASVTNIRTSPSMPQVRRCSPGKSVTVVINSSSYAYQHERLRSTSAAVATTGLPQQGSGGHLHGLKVVYT